MHLPIRVGIQEALKELKALRNDMEDTGFYFDSFEYLLRGRMVERIKEVGSKKRKNGVDEGSRTSPQPAPRSTPDMRKRLRESTASPEETKTKKPAEKRAKDSKKEEEWVEVEVPTRKDLRKNKMSEPENRRTERPKRARSEAVLIKPSEGISYAAILKNLKSRVNLEELGVTIGGIRETRQRTSWSK